MAFTASRLQVFVSSTSEDLVDHRKTARDVILDLKWHPVMQENFGAEPGATVDTCRRILEACDVVLLIVAWRRGWVPTPEQGGIGRDSITALELAHARERGIPVLVLLAADDWPNKLCEDDPEPRRWVKEFRTTLNQVAKFFPWEPPAASAAQRLPAFRSTVRETLLNFKESRLERGARPEGGGNGLDFFGTAQEALLDGKAIPVVGPGIHAGRPLGSAALVAELLGDAASNQRVAREGLSVATAAEYRERCSGSRGQFLRHFRKSLEQQSSQAAAAPVLDLLGKVGPLPLVVSATYDELLEQSLERASRKVVSVAHVVRSFEGEEDGRILVRRAGSAPQIVRVDELTTAPDECIVYKPQGSPFLHDDLDPDREIDTVVVTEADHLAFLRRLESQETGVPPAIRKRFRRSPLLFLGYEMDMWHYRLMMHVFQSAGRGGRGGSTLAVRAPDTPIEEAAWMRLNADLIRMDANEFARRVLAVPQGA